VPRDLVSGLFWLAVAGFAIVQGVALKLGTLSRPGPGFFPFWGGVVLGLLSLVLLATSPRRRAAIALSGLRSRGLLVVVAALLGYVVLLEPLGFGTVTFVFLLLLFRLERRGWVVSAVSALGGAVACYALFQLWLKTQLPVGPLGF
jgi:Tripartite tricarboxylate transporter TctB family